MCCFALFYLNVSKLDPRGGLSVSTLLFFYFFFLLRCDVLILPVLSGAVPYIHHAVRVHSSMRTRTGDCSNQTSRGDFTAAEPPGNRFGRRVGPGEQRTLAPAEVKHQTLRSQFLSTY